jgi:predicted dehydrogenase
MPRPPELRVGIIGTGFAARRTHIPAWASLPGARVTALCDSSSEALDAAGREVPHATRFTDARALLESGVDAVSICAWNAAHYPLALAALQAGKHVLCEKPLGVSVAEVCALGEAADARSLVLMAHHPLRFAGPALAVADCVRAGRLGPVHHVRVRALRRDRAPSLPGFTDAGLSGGGAVLDLGVHALDIALGVMGFPRPTRATGTVRTVFAQGDRIAGHWGAWDRDRFTVEDSGTGFVHFENGATLSLECAWLSHEGEEGIACDWFGEAGNLSWPACELTSQGKVFSRESLSVVEAEDPRHAGVRAFYESVTTGKPSPVSWREAEVSLAVIEALYASSRAGREVEILLKS